MTDKKLHRWITVNDYMDTDYRNQVVELALAHREHAPLELRKIANSVLSSIAVPGFRTFQKVPVSVTVPYVVQQFQKRRDVTTIIISLWSVACQGVIAEVKKQAVLKGLCFQEPWTWKEAEEGYYVFDEIPKLFEIIEPLAQEKEKQEHDHWMLAVLWLSGGLSDQLVNTSETGEIVGSSAPISPEPDGTTNTASENSAEKETVTMQEGSSTLTGDLEELIASPIESVLTQEAHPEDVWAAMGLVDLLECLEQIKAQIKTSQNNLLALTSDSTTECRKIRPASIQRQSREYILQV